MKFEPTDESIKSHEVPGWYHDAKFGIFVHWGLFSVPAWAPYSQMDIVEKMQEEGFEAIKQSPYAEWYLNSMQFKDQPTWQHHVDTYGEDFPYDGFQPMFEDASAAMNPEQWADIFSDAGARYVIMVTKHHDGYLMWPSQFPHPDKPDFFSKRDLVGELTQSVKIKGMRMGYYYSGVFDWSFLHEPICDTYSFLQNFGQDKAYADYANRHFRELIDRYSPSILWNDIGSPPDLDNEDLIAYFYNRIEEGVINDRWRKHLVPQDPEAHAAYKKFLQEIPKEVAKEAMKPGIPPYHFDFLTPEYSSFSDIKDYKWEATRGIGRSFGYSRLETESDMLSPDELIRYLVDVVSKNGNLLLNVGPMADGTIPEMQQKPLRALGKWLDTNGEAIFNTRPWERAEGRTTDGTEVRFTQNRETLYATLLSQPEKNEVSIKEISIDPGSEIELLGGEKNLVWELENQDLTVKLPEPRPESAIWVFKIGHK